MKHLRLLAALAFLAPSARGAAPEPAPPAAATVMVGNRPITLPPPAGFVRCDGIFPEWDQLTQSMLPATNRMLATYGTPADHEMIKAHRGPAYAANCNVQANRELEDKEIGEQTFAGIRRQLKAELDRAMTDIEREIGKLVAKGNDAMKQEYGVEDALAVSDTAVLGYFEDSDTALGFTMAMKTTAKTTDGGVETSKSVVAGLITPVNGRLLYFYATLPFTARSDRAAAERTVAAWRDAVVAANPRVAGPRAGFWFLNGSNISRAALIGAVAGAVGGGLAGLFVMLKRRRKPPSG